MKVLILQHIACEGAGTLGTSLNQADVHPTIISLYQREKIPQNLRDYNGLVILGGPMNVYEENKYPFLRKEQYLIKEALLKGIPTLGICLGAQLIAKTCGAKVKRGIQKEIGWYDIRITDSGMMDAIFSTFPQRFKAFQWHGDTFDIPRGAIHLAASNLFLHQAFRISNIYALQFHLEVDEEMIRSWMQEYEAELTLLPYISPRQIWEETKAYIANLNRLANIVYEKFSNLVNSNA